MFVLCEGGLLEQGVLPRRLRGRTVSELVFGAVPMSGGGAALKVLLLSEATLCAFVTSRTRAVCVAFVGLHRRDEEGLLAAWPLLWSTADVTAACSVALLTDKAREAIKRNDLLCFSCLAFVSFFPPSCNLEIRGKRCGVEHYTRWHCCD